MTIKLNVFDTLEEAEKAQNNDFEEWKESQRLKAAEQNELKNWDRYFNVEGGTTNWSEVMETVDGRWAYFSCPTSTAAYNTIDYEFGVLKKDIEE